MNNGLGHVLTAVGVKPLQFCCQSLPLSYQLHERQLLFYRRLLLSDNIFVRTLAGLPRIHFEMLGIAAKYGLGDLRYLTETIKNALWFSSVIIIITDNSNLQRRAAMTISHRSVYKTKVFILNK